MSHLIVGHYIRVRKHEGKQYLLNERSWKCDKWKNGNRKKCRIIHFVYGAQNYICKRYVVGKSLKSYTPDSHQWLPPSGEEG